MEEERILQSRYAKPIGIRRLAIVAAVIVVAIIALFIYEYHIAALSQSQNQTTISPSTTIAPQTYYHLSVMAPIASCVSSAGGNYLPGSAVPISATPTCGGIPFAQWVGNGAQNYSGSKRSTFVAMHSNVTEIASYYEPTTTVKTSSTIPTSTSSVGSTVQTTLSTLQTSSTGSTTTSSSTITSSTTSMSTTSSTSTICPPPPSSSQPGSPC